MRALFALLSFLGLAAPAAAMTLDAQGHTLTLSGLVDGYTADTVIRFLSDHREIDTIIVKQSGGGSASEMLALAREIRARRITTMVSGRCISACAIIFMGGAERTIAPGAPPAETFVAFHGVYRSGYLNTDWTETIANAVVGLSGRRMPRDVALAMASLPVNSAWVAFFHPRVYHRPDGATVAWCEGSERNRAADCPSRSGMDGLAYGVFTR